jgi:hypothetical protein
VSSLDDAGGDVGLLGSVVPVGCGLLVAWSMLTSFERNNTTQVSWSTVHVSFDGSLAGPARAHPSLTQIYGKDPFNGTIELAANAGGVGALVNDETGCLFLPLDATGADRGPVSALPGVQCVSLAGAGASGFSYLTGNMSPTSLVTLDATGAVTANRALGDPVPREVWGRLSRSDGSFLLETSYSDSVGINFTSWLQPFDSVGDALSPPVTTDAETAPLLATTTASGALAAWEWSGSAAFQAIDANGAPAGPIVREPVPVAQAPFIETIAPMSSGDVLLVIIGDEQTGGTWPVYVQQRAPDGTARGPLSTLPPFSSSLDPSGLVAVAAPDGAHALLLYTDLGVRALPLVCAD